MNNNIKNILIILCSFTVLIIFFSIIKKRHKNEIIANMEFTLGEITEVETINFKGPKRTSITYKYRVNGVEYKGTTSSSPDEKYHLSREYLLYKSYPVVYSRRKNNESDMLIVREDSIRYNLLR